MSNALRVIRPKHARRNELKPPIMVSCPPLRIYLFGYITLKDLLYSNKKLNLFFKIVCAAIICFL